MTLKPSPAGLREEYENTFLSRAALNEKYQLANADLDKFRKAEGWQVRKNTPEALKAYSLDRSLRKIATAVVGTVATAATTFIDTDGGGAAASSTDATVQDRKSGSTPKSRRTGVGGDAKHRRALIKRLYDLYDAKLAEIEARVAARSKMTRLDLETELKSFAALIKHYPALTEISDADGAALAAVAPTVGVATSDDDAERLRQDLVERFDRLRQSHAGESPAGGTDHA